MARIGVLRTVEGGRLGFDCPGCKEWHVIPVGAGEGPRWGWNGSHEAPTFTPSIHVKTGHFVTGRGSGIRCTYAFDDEPGCPCTSCHSFVTDGQIKFLSDCTHALAGQTVALAPPAD